MPLPSLRHKRVHIFNLEGVESPSSSASDEVASTSIQTDKSRVKRQNSGNTGLATMSWLARQRSTGPTAQELLVHHVRCRPAAVSDDIALILAVQQEIPASRSTMETLLLGGHYSSAAMPASEFWDRYIGLIFWHPSFAALAKRVEARALAYQQAKGEALAEEEAREVHPGETPAVAASSTVASPSYAPNHRVTLEDIDSVFEGCDLGTPVGGGGSDAAPSNPTTAACAAPSAAAAASMAPGRAARSASTFEEDLAEMHAIMEDAATHEQALRSPPGSQPRQPQQQQQQQQQQCGAQGLADLPPMVLPPAGGAAGGVPTTRCVRLLVDGGPYFQGKRSLRLAGDEGAAALRSPIRLAEHLSRVLALAGGHDRGRVPKVEVWDMDYEDWVQLESVGEQLAAQRCRLRLYASPAAET